MAGVISVNPVREGEAEACPACTFLNENGASACSVCGASLQGAQATASAAAQWPCPTCTFLNEGSATSCSMCSARNPDAPPSAWSTELFGDTLNAADGTPVPTAEKLAGKKIVLLYFSAHWCPPCRSFTPVLAETYSGYQGGDVECVFLSSDRDQASFDEYFATMPCEWVEYRAEY